MKSPLLNMGVLEFWARETGDGLTSFGHFESVLAEDELG